MISSGQSVTPFALTPGWEGGAGFVLLSGGIVKAIVGGGWADDLSRQLIALKEIALKEIVLISTKENLFQEVLSLP
jgi:hypothetical protein